MRIKIDIKTKEKLRQAFAAAASSLIEDCKEPAPEAIVFRALVRAFETLRRCPDAERSWQNLRSPWPHVIYGRQEQEVAHWEHGMLAQQEGRGVSDEWSEASAKPAPCELDFMDAIFEAYPRALVGRNVRRDWRILCGLATGRAPRHVAKAASCSYYCVRDRRQVQITAIAREFADIMPKGLSKTPMESEALMGVS